MAKLAIDFAGMKLKNPIIAASAGTTKDAMHCKMAEDAGCSAVILKSIQEEMVNRYNPFPRMSVFKNGIPGFLSNTFMTYEQAFEGGIEEYCEEIIKVKKTISIPVIASLNCVTKEAWYNYAIEVEKAGADAIEIVPSCPVGALVREAAEFYPVAREALLDIKKVVKIPVGIKMTQQMSNPIICAKDLEADGADWITMFNRSSGLQINLDTMEPVMHKGFCGHGGPWVTQSVMRWIAASYPHLQIPVSATGGVTNYEDVIKYVLSGAVNVQIATLIYLKGFDVVKTILEQLENYLESHGIDDINHIIGYAAKKVLPLNEADRSKRYFARFNAETCISCKKCFPVCTYDAITNDGKRPYIDEDKCDGCGLCSQVCGRTQAITMMTR